MLFISIVVSRGMEGCGYCGGMVLCCQCIFFACFGGGVRRVVDGNMDRAGCAGDGGGFAVGVVRGYGGGNGGEFTHIIPCCTHGYPRMPLYPHQRMRASLQKAIRYGRE